MVTQKKLNRVNIRITDLIDLLVNSNFDVNEPEYKVPYHTDSSEFLKKFKDHCNNTKWTLHADEKGVTVEWET